MSIYEKFNNSFDLAGLKEDIEAASANDGDYEKLPYDDYEVKIDRLEIGETKSGNPKVVCWFKVVAGPYKGRLIFMNQTIAKGVQIKIANQFLDSLESGVDIEFEDFVQYASMLEAIKDILDTEGAEYQLHFSENEKGYDTFKIVQKFDD